MVGLAAVAGLALLLAGCAESEPTPKAVLAGPTATPPTQATIAALAQARGGGTPTPTPVAPGDKKVVLDFATSHAAIDRDWERFRAEFDAWREGLVACDVSSVEVTLRQFAGDFSRITEKARALPRHAGLRGLADKLIEAAEREEGAIRLLRDNWQPDDPTVFEEADVERSAASDLQKQAQDELGVLQDKTSPLSREDVIAYSLAFKELNSDWDSFHRNYDSFRAREADLTSLEMVDSLSRLIDEFSGVVATIRNLPESGITRPVSQILAEAAQDEDLALRRLRGTFQKMETDKSEEAVDGTGSDEGGVTFTPLDPALFDAFDAQLVASNTLRRQARNRLADAQEGTSIENEAAVAEFTKDYNTLLGEWNLFHEAYDDWRRSEGGCDRAEARQTLGSFTIDFGELAATVRDLPRATFLRPMGELLVEAVEREEQALRVLRNVWRPFDAEVYIALDQARNASGKLRRQAASGLEQLLAQYDIAFQPLSR